MRWDDLQASIQKTSYGSTALANGYAYDIDGSRLVDLMELQDVHSNSPSLEASIADENGIRVKSVFFITSGSRE